MRIDPRFHNYNNPYGNPPRQNLYDRRSFKPQEETTLPETIDGLELLARYIWLVWIRPFYRKWVKPLVLLVIRRVKSLLKR